MPLPGRRVTRRLVRYCYILSFCASLLAVSSVQAGTIVRVSTSMGNYSLELFDEDAPQTVQNFLNYVTRGDYNQTYVHRVEDFFVVQGGAYRYQPYVGPVDIRQDPPIPNEFKISNTRGTIAMAKLDGDPDSATNQWFVNLSDNSSNLDSNNGGFTVFGTVLGTGMQILDAIDTLQVIQLGTKASRAPFITEGYESGLDFVYVNMEVVDRFSAALHVYESSQQLLMTSVSVDGGAELLSLNFSLVEDGGNIVFEANPDSVITLRNSPEGVASFSTTDSRLRIPVLEVNLGGNVQQISNVVLVRSAPGSFRFNLETYGP